MQFLSFDFPLVVVSGLSMGLFLGFVVALLYQIIYQFFAFIDRG